MFNPDQPIQSASQDLLGRDKFAIALADSLVSYKGIESVVVALFGAWGSGKTSILNMALDHLSRFPTKLPEREKPVIIRFNPWNFSDQNQLISQFFRHISTALKRKDYSGTAKAIGDHLKTYANLFEPVAFVVPPVLFVSKMFRGLGSAAKKVAALNSTDLIAIKSELNKLLENQARKIIVVIDDIDRLNNTEIRQVFQLVKSLGDFTNTVYVLAFDKNVVLKALSKVQEGSGLEYLEKVVQVPFEVPSISREEVYSLLFAQLNLIIENLPSGKWNNNYWANLWHAAIKHFFNTIRDVTRYVNSLRFTYQMINQEVNPVDFFAISAIQVFLPDVYYGIRDNKDLFSGILPSDFGRSQSEKSQGKERCDEIIGRSSSNTEQLKDLLKRMFPRLEALYGNMHYGYDSLSEWRGDGRIASPDIFEIYFRLHVPRGQISQREIDTILSLAADRDQFTQALLGLNKSNRILSLLERLEDYTRSKIPAEHIQNIISSLMDVGDLFPEGERGFLSTDTPMRLLRICYQLSHRFQNQDDRCELFRNAIGSAMQSIHTIINEVAVQDQQHGRHESKGNPDPEEKRTVSSTQLDELEQLALAKIQEWSKDERLAIHPKLPSILFAWKTWGKEEDVRLFVSTMTRTDIGLADFISSFLSKSTSYSGSDYVGKDHWKTHLKSIAEFIPIEAIKDRARQLLTSEVLSLSKKHKHGLQVFVDTVDGKNNDPFYS